MRRPRPSPEHAEAVSRRLATLSAELASVRGEPPTAAGLTHTRVRGLPEGSVDGEAEVPFSVVPVPGRHASRRTQVPVRDRGGRLAVGLGVPRLTPVHVAVLAVVAAVAMAGVTWLVVSSRAEVTTVAPRVDPPAAVAGTASDPADPGATTSASGETTEVVVDVAGKVRRPGIAVLPGGSRVVDAIEAAGGARGGVDLAALNLARVLVDGEQILVGVAGPAGVAGQGVEGSPPAPGALVNLNSADEAALDTLPGVGPVTAQAIIAWRGSHGGFTAVDELLEVDGIGEATLADLAPLVTV